MKKFYFIFFFLGVLTALPYALPVLWFLPWISLIPFSYILIKYGEGFKKRKAYLLGLSFGMGYFGLTYHWFTSFYNMEFLGLKGIASALLVAVCWIGLSLIQALEFGMVPVLYKVAMPSKKRPWLGALIITSLWIIFEWQQNLFWRGVPWARLALTQAGAPVFQQSASLFGGLFVGGIIVAFSSFSAAGAFVFVENKGCLKKKSFNFPKKSIVLCSVAAVIFVTNVVFGMVKLAIPYKTEGDRLGAAVIQGNISSADKWNTSVWTALDIYIDLTERCVAEAKAKGIDIQLVVWPETVLKDGVYGSVGIREALKSSAKELNVTILTGAFDYARIGEEKALYNAIFAFYPDGTVDETKYYKQRLVPFGEFTPMEGVINTFLPILTELNILSEESYTAGTESVVFDGADGISSAKVGSLICFDSIYDILTVNAVRNGAEIMTLSTNDSWFSDSAAVYQHNRQASLRAIESGRFFVRAANTGVSSIISPKGEVLTEVAPLVEGYTFCEINRISDRTLYSYVGNIIVYFSMAFYTGALVYERKLSKYRDIHSEA